MHDYRLVKCHKGKLGALVISNRETWVGRQGRFSWGNLSWNRMEASAYWYVGWILFLAGFQMCLEPWLCYPALVATWISHNCFTCLCISGDQWFHETHMKLWGLCPDHGLEGILLQLWVMDIMDFIPNYTKLQDSRWINEEPSFLP